jgi:pyrimidine operon attenuation protein / uracil phosphoribosyltransferase
MQPILDNTAIHQKINRLAHELSEDCYQESLIFIGGIHGNGIELAKRLQTGMSEILSNNIDLFEIFVNKEEPWKEAIRLSVPEEKLKNAYLILVDDVVNSGKTMQFALTKLLTFPTAAIKTVALVDRTHRRFPIKADFVGLSLSTTLKERVEVDLTEGNMKAFLI